MMDPDKQAAIERAGFSVGDAEDFLEMNVEEIQILGVLNRAIRRAGLPLDHKQFMEVYRKSKEEAEREFFFMSDAEWAEMEPTA